jgi:hemoglobin
MTQPNPNLPPSLYDWAGGAPALKRLTTIFYDKVAADPVLAPVFATMGADHPEHVAAFVGEVFGGPKVYSAAHGEPGGHAEMVSHHVGRRLTDAQRRRWVSLICDAADKARLPDDPEFRSAFVAYLEWGTRLAVINSAPDAVPDPDAPMPHWGWGEPGGPYRPAG